MLGLGYYLQNRIQNLEEKWPAHPTITIRGTISQMFLMYLRQMLTERHDLRCVLNRGSKCSDWRPHKSIICSADRNITIRGQLTMLIHIFIKC